MEKYIITGVLLILLISMYKLTIWQVNKDALSDRKWPKNFKTNQNK